MVLRILICTVNNVNTEHTLWSYPSCPWKKASWLLLNNQWVACVPVYLPTPPSSVDRQQFPTDSIFKNLNYPTLCSTFIYNTNLTCILTTYSTKINYPIYDSSTEAHTMFSHCTILKWFLLRLILDMTRYGTRGWKGKEMNQVFNFLCHAHYNNVLGSMLWSGVMTLH